jgi:hypothetical protein
VQSFRSQQLKRPQQFAAALQQHRRVRTRKFHQNFRMFPLAILRNRRIDRDPVLQLEAAMRNDGLQKLPNLLRSHNLVGNRHKYALGF